MTIHPTAIIAKTAKLGQGVEVGPFCTIGPEAKIGAGTRLISHVVVTGKTTIGKDNVIYPFASLGQPSPDRKYKGEAATLTIGDGNDIREGVTMHIGTAADKGTTSVGSNNLLMAGTHVAHDCIVGNHCIFSNNTTLAGHVTVGDWVIISGFAGAHQFCRIGAHAFLGMGALANGDVTPFTMVGGNSIGRPRGINSEGLKRRGFSPERIAAIKRAYRTLFVAGLPLAEAREQLAQQALDSEDVRLLLDFIGSGERPLLR